MERKNFIRTSENFICENCGTEIKGTGYTNHCPDCLYSKHVDVVPGDRASACGGMMEPVAVSLKGGLPDQVVHRCVKCGYTHKNKIDKADSLDVLVSLPNE